MKWRLHRVRVGICTVVASFAMNASAASPVVLDLNGQWDLRADGDSTAAIPATVPGVVHTDLQAAGKIADPFFGDNAAGLNWVAEKTWVYSRTFTASPDFLKKKHIVLRCEGLDTLASLKLNGKELGHTDNMFRTWEFDVADALRLGENRLTVTFSPLKPYIESFIEAAKGKGSNMAYAGISNVRKALYSNGWDFAPPGLPAMGIYRPIRLIAYDVTRIRNLLIDTQVDQDKPATVSVVPTLSADTPADVRIRASLTLVGKPISAAASAASDVDRKVSLTVPEPCLWWPNGMGERPMYDLKIEAIDAAGAVLDTQTRRIGLRKIELLPKSADRPLRLRVNGREIYARGASWIPSDMFLPRVTTENLRSLLGSAAAANMNLIRTWGGGYYEEDAFYDLCDELGLLVWHDFKFACNGYPGRNPAFAANTKQEVAEQVTRLSTHPSIAVWCGNNEIEAIVHRYGVMSQADYDYLFHELIGGGLKALLPTANYVGGSPEEGDEHNWWVWHVGANFEKYRESHGWMTEFGFQSFPVPETVNAFTAPADRDSVLSPVMKWHQHNGNKRGNEMILDQIARYFRPVKDFESTLWLSQINQAYGLTMGIEHWRSDWPKSSGSLVWQLDDCWPGTSWATIDYFGRWKAAQYSVRTAFAPIMVTGVYDAKSAMLPLTICSDIPTAYSAEVRWSVTDTAGEAVDFGTRTVSIPAGTTAAAGPRLNLQAAIDRTGKQNILVWVDVLRDGKIVAAKTFFVVEPKTLTLQEPTLKTAVTAAGDGYDIELTSAKPALWAWVDLPNDADAKYSDNFINISKSHAAKIHVRPSKPITIDAIRQQLIARSLFDTAAPEAVMNLRSLTPSPQTAGRP